MSEKHQPYKDRTEEFAAYIDAKNEWIDREALIAAGVPGCEACLEGADNNFGPPHDGSTSCESGSIASGGTEAHCVCHVCF